MSRDPRPIVEQQLHRFTVEMLTFNAVPGVVWWHTPNGEVRDPGTAAKLKRMGVRPGVADIAIVLPPEGRAAFLEPKSSRGRASAEQRAFAVDCEAAGAHYALAATPEAVTAALRSWGALRPAREAA